MKADSHNIGASSMRWSHVIFYVVLLGLTLRVINFVLSDDNPLLYMPVLDERYYIDAAKVISEGNWLNQGAGAFMDPAYSYFLGMIFFLFGDNLTTVRLIQILLDSLNILLVYAIGARIWNKPSGMMAAVCYAVYPVAFFYSLLILKTTLTITSLLGFIWLFLKALEVRRLHLWYILGAFAGLMIYLRANLILIIAFTLVYMLFLCRSLGPRVWGRVLVFLIGVTTLIAVNGMRSYFAGKDLALFNTQGGRLLYSSNNPDNLTGRYNVPSFARPDPVLSEKDFQKEAEHRLEKPLNPKEVSQYWRNEAIRFLIKHPAKIPILLLNKMRGSVSNCEIPNNHSYYVASQFSPLTGLLYPCFAFIFGFGIPGILLGIRRSRKAIILLIPLLTVIVTMLIFYAASRFRMPAVPFLCLGTGVSIYLLIDFARRCAWLKGASIAVGVLILGLLSLSIPCPVESGNEEFFLGKAYWKIGKVDLAHDVAIKGSERYPNQSRFHNLLGMICVSKGMPDKGMENYCAALRLDPENSDVYHNMGLLYLSKRRSSEAIASFKKALSLEIRADSLFYTAHAYDELGDFRDATAYYKRSLEITDKKSPIHQKAVDRLSQLRQSP